MPHYITDHTSGGGEGDEGGCDRGDMLDQPVCVLVATLGSLVHGGS